MFPERAIQAEGTAESKALRGSGALLGRGEGAGAGGGGRRGMGEASASWNAIGSLALLLLG